MRVHIAADHAGFELREALIKHLSEENYEVVDHGAKDYDKLDAYPPMCIACGKAVAGEPDSLGIVIGGSGNGEQMAANLVNGVRAALVWNESTAALAREHNNANIIAIGARQHSVEEAIRLVDVFLTTPFSNEARHQERIDMMSEYEQQR
ncbi:ribose-5-phosphate isomerase [Gleimia hominis]|uniref:Ribose-5-phosphate isomerase B n=1 Tax=Gleimia hominis TaxID=595468 RepID=A0ABU3IAI4_9ACTO|nr:ribose-5-phosphate isomerase [Gleimia hominis]MDT3767389.1 ribose-5-phosphate isomerase [Gleimia hominis]